MESFLAPEDIRQDFYEALTAFARSLKVALGTVKFYEDNPEKRIKLYKSDLRFFHRLRMSVKQRYAEAVDYKEYEAKVRKLMNEHIRATGTSAITEQVNIFDAERFDEEVAKLHTPASKADTIAYRLKRTIIEHLDENPAFYRKFSQLIDETIQNYREGRINELEYLEQMENALETVRSGHDVGLPPQLSRYRHAAAYYATLEEALSLEPDTLADIAIAIEDQIEKRKIRDWIHNIDIQNAMKNDIEDHLYDSGISLKSIQIDMLLDQLIDIARYRNHL